MLPGEAYNLLCSSNTVCQYLQVSAMMCTVLPAQLLQKPLHQLTLSPQNTVNLIAKMSESRACGQLSWKYSLLQRYCNCFHFTIFPICCECSCVQFRSRQIPPKTTHGRRAELASNTTRHQYRVYIAYYAKDPESWGWKGFQGASNPNPKRLSDLYKVTVSGEDQVMNSSCSSHPLYWEKQFISLLPKIP